MTLRGDSSGTLLVSRHSVSSHLHVRNLDSAERPSVKLDAIQHKSHISHLSTPHLHTWQQLTVPSSRSEHLAKIPEQHSLSQLGYVLYVSVLHLKHAWHGRMDWLKCQLSVRNLKIESQTVILIPLLPLLVRCRSSTARCSWVQLEGISSSSVQTHVWVGSRDMKVAPLLALRFARRAVRHMFKPIEVFENVHTNSKIAGENLKMALGWLSWATQTFRQNDYRISDRRCQLRTGNPKWSWCQTLPLWNPDSGFGFISILAILKTELYLGWT